MENNNINNWSVKLSSYKLNIQYMKDTRNALVDCIARLGDANSTDHVYKPEGQESRHTLLGDLPPVVNTVDTNSTETISVNVSDRNTERSNDIKILQGHIAYSKHIS